MNLWRISDHLDLGGVGGFKRSGRWHNRGKKVVYLSDSPSGTLLERLVHLELDPEDVPEFYTRLKVAVPDDIAIEQLDPPDTADWMLDEKLTRSMGDACRQDLSCASSVGDCVGCLELLAQSRASRFFPGADYCYHARTIRSEAFPIWDCEREVGFLRDSRPSLGFPRSCNPW